jgi:hypothetical protein
MSALRKTLAGITLAMAITVVFCAVATAAPRITKSVSPMEDGSFLIKIRVAAAGDQIFGLRFIDPQASIRNVFAPKGWCIVTDGEELMARTGSEPIKDGTSLEFIIHSDSDVVSYGWTAFGRIKQIGTPGTL